MHSNNPIVPYISLCSGYEGIGLGLHRCIPNLRAVAYCEREAFAIANLVAKMEEGLLDAAPVFTDVTNFPWADYAPYMAGGILSFGWPCQPVSCAGKRKATEDERWLFDIIADGISILRPEMLFAENVEGLLSARMPDGSSVFGHCIERLESLHYKVAAGIFSASEVGAPHQRKRVFILAHSADQRPEWGSILGSPSASEAVEGCGAWAWPSRPGEPQHGWEPRRVVANTNKLRLEEHGLLHPSVSVGSSGGTDGEAMGNAASKRLCGGSEDGANQQPEMLGTGHEAMGNANCGRLSSGFDTRSCSETDSGGQDNIEQTECGAMGNAECFRLESTRNDGTMEKESGSSSAERCEPSYATKKSSNSNISFSEIKSEMGRNIDGNTYGMDISKLSGLCHSELAEIREWMVKGDNRTDELRSCGNGVVPATAERAFRVLMEELINK